MTTRQGYPSAVTVKEKQIVRRLYHVDIPGPGRQDYGTELEKREDGRESMARGPKKSIEEKIEAKAELIAALETRLESERRELEEMVREKRLKELETVSDLMDECGLEAGEVADILREYMNERATA